MAAFYNRATLSYGGNVIDSNTVRGELNAALAIGKSAVNDSYRPGDTVSYVVTLTNAGASDATELQLRDDLGAYAFGSESRVPLEYVQGSARYLVNGELQPAPEVTGEGGGLVIRGIRVPANGSAAILYAARVNAFAPLGERAAIINTVRLDDAASASVTLPANPGSAAGNASGAMGNANGTAGNPNGTAGNPNGTAGNPNGTAGNPNGMTGNPAEMAAGMALAAAMPVQIGAPVLPVFASAQIAPDAAARLSIGKSLSPASVSPGEELTYTLTIENEGATAVSAAEGAVVSDVFNPRMNIASVRFNGVEWSAPANYSYDANTGVFATAPGQLTVPAATFSQDAASGRWTVQPGISTIEITGTLR